MGLVELIVLILAIALIWTAFVYLPIAQPFKNILLAVLCIVLAVWLLGQFGIARI